MIYLFSGRDYRKDYPQTVRRIREGLLLPIRVNLLGQDHKENSRGSFEGGD